MTLNKGKSYISLINILESQGKAKAITWVSGKHRGRKFLFDTTGRIVEITESEKNGDVPVLQLTQNLMEDHDIWKKSSEWCWSYEDDTAFVENLQGKPRLFLLGSGHVSQALYDILCMMDFDLIINDPRKEFATKERFSKASQVLNLEYTEVFKSYSPRSTDWFVIVTPGHQDDFICASSALQRNSAYVGMIGSKGKVATTKKRLKDSGICEEKISQLYSPIGLDIGAQTPMEIAVSIAAQIIKIRRGQEVCVLEPEICNGVKALEVQKGLGMMVTIIKKEGSGPREQGARMLVNSNGQRLAGTIGGGAVENAALIAVREMASNKESFWIRDYDLSNAQAANLGMICGGRVQCMFERLDFSL